MVLLTGLILIIATGGVLAADFQVVPAEVSGPMVERVGPPTYYMQDLDRYNQPTPDAHHLPWKEQPVTRDTYMKWIDDSGHLRYADSPQHGVYGPRHLMPVLAKYVQTGDAKYGQACVTMLQDYDRWMREETQKTGWHSNYMHEPTLIGLYARYLVPGRTAGPAEGFVVQGPGPVHEPEHPRVGNGGGFLARAHAPGAGRGDDEGHRDRLVRGRPGSGGLESVQRQGVGRFLALSRQPGQ